ncbi:MAG: murein hydrolase activator EnvC family protein [Pikeienuella sp.]
MTRGPAGHCLIGLAVMMLCLWAPGSRAVDVGEAPVERDAAAVLPEGVAEAKALLAEAEAALGRAATTAARRAALGLAVRAHELALAALRAGLRRLAEEDRRLAAELADENAQIVAVLGALQSVSTTPRSAVLAHPKGSLAAARAAMLLSDMTPKLEAEIAAVARRLDALRSLRVRQEIARAEARGALAALQALRTETTRVTRVLAGARAKPLTNEAMRRQAEEAAARARDLEDLAEALGAGLAAPDRPFEQRRGTLIPPVTGQITGSFGGVDPWGRTGQGIAMTAPAYSEVRSPVSATIRYAGPLIDYGEVVILEPEATWLIVLAGLASTDRRVGETVIAGERLGDLGGPLPSSEEFLLEAGSAVPMIENADLYVEIRQSGTAVDPAPWFRPTEE